MREEEINLLKNILIGRASRPSVYITIFKREKESLLSLFFYKAFYFRKATQKLSTKKYKAETVRAAFSERFVGEESPDGEQRLFCPICEDMSRSNSPSASMNPESGLWNCLKSNHGGSIYDLVRDLKKEFGFDIRSASMKGRHSNPGYSQTQIEKMQGAKGSPAHKGAPLPDDDKLAQWQQSLLSNKTKLQALMAQRGLERQTILDFELGWDGNRYTIPVRDADGELINVRRYKLGAGSGDKMLNLPGHGNAALYRPDILRDNDEIVITEGEMDCIILNQFGIPAVTHTAGASTFRPAWAGQFVDKKVFVVYDVDDAGRKGAKKVEQTLKAFADEVYLVDLPLETKGADITDYLHKEGHSTREFQGLMSAVQEASANGKRNVDRPVATNGDKVSLNDSMSQDNQSKVMELTVSIAGKQQEPYTAPRRITATCDQSKGAACTMCPLSARDGQAEYLIREDDEQLFRFVDVSEQRRQSLLKEVTGARCTDRVEYEIDENHHVEELLVQPSVDDRRDDETQQPVRRTAFAVGTHATTVNRKMRMVGKNVADPKSGKLKFVSWTNEPVEMDIDKFEITEEMRDRLKKFQPSAEQSPLDKCIEIASDLSSNVTHIYGRDLLHVAYDLVYHSVISFKIHDVTVQRGWLEMAVIGDTRTGKSEIATRMAKHYHSGVVQSCEGMSFAGLVGGVQQIDGRWHMTWGVIPMNDRRLVILDEVSGLKEKDVIEQMSSIRSSGVAQITKIAYEETSARTRLIWMMNPADGSSIKDHPQAGIGGLKTVVPNAEDIARFDFVAATAKGDVDTKIINSAFQTMHEPEYSSEDCEALVKWAWSLTRADIQISSRAAAAAVKSAMELGERYVDDPPFIQSENVRYKILRIAAAIAARTFSVSAKGKLLVNVEHVKDAVRFLDMLYEQDSLGYARQSRRVIESHRKAEEKRSVARSYLHQNEQTVLLTLRMVGGSNFKVRDLIEFGGMTPEEAKSAVHQLLKWQLISMKSRGDIGISSTLISLMRELEEEE